MLPLDLCGHRTKTHDSGNCKLLLLRILEQVQDIIPDNDALLSAENTGCHWDQARVVDKVSRMDLHGRRMEVLGEKTKMEESTGSGFGTEGLVSGS